MARFFGLPGNVELAAALAALTRSQTGVIESRRFPDGESYVRIHGAPDEKSFLVRTLAGPDEQFLPLAFAARALRGSGAAQVVLVAPYLPYLRQDRRFNAGEAVSSRIFADLVSREFDGLVTVDPHLHRYRSLAEIYDIPTTVVHTAEVIGVWIGDQLRSPVVLGPDSESSQWVREIASVAGCPWAVFGKMRKGDRDVELAAPALEQYRDRTPVLVDDIISSRATMIGAAKLLIDAGMPPSHCIAVHGLFDGETAAELVQLTGSLLTTDTVPNPYSVFEVAPLIARRLAAGPG